MAVSPIFFAIPLLVVSSSFARQVGITIQTSSEDSWQPQQLALMKKASHVVFKRIHSHAVAQCAYRSSFRENRDQLRRKWGQQITVLNKNPNITLKVRKTALKANVYGLAQIDIATIDRRSFKIHNLDIVVNELHLSLKRSPYPGFDASSLWVNTIAHEIAHNFGYRHGSGGSWQDSYPGFFPTELGFCVMSNGKHGSDFNNLKRRQQLQKGR